MRRAPWNSTFRLHLTFLKLSVMPAFARLGFWHVSRQKNCTRFGSRSKTKCSDMRKVMSSFYLWRRTLLP